MTHRETLCVQAGYDPAPGDPRVVPIAQSTTYYYDDPSHVADLFDLAAEGHMYSRISNPTCVALESKVAALEGGVGAVSTSSGQSANLLAILAVTRAGEHVVAAANLYGGTHTLFTSTLAAMGIQVTFVDPGADDAALAAAIRPETRLLFGETLGNPRVDVLDIARWAEVAHAHQLPLVIDNSLATPVLCRPFEHGADVVTHSTTKYLDGHATSVGGLVVAQGGFTFTPERHAILTDADPAYHGLSWTDTFGEAALLAKVRAGLLRDIGSTMAPMNAFLTNLGVETLALRMERTSANALTLARYLEDHEKVAWVSYPGLESAPTHALAQKYLPDGGSGIVAFGLKGGADAGRDLLARVELASLVVHLGDLRTHLLHPASMTHRQLAPEAQLAAGVSPDLVRLSVGIEHVDDIRADLDAALATL